MAFASISSNLLDEDLATCDKSKHFLRSCLNDSKKIIPAGSILQLQNIANISVPKEDRELPRSYHPGSDVLKVGLSDGDFNIYALLYHSSPELSMNTPPGTKIRLSKPVSVTHGTFCLSSDIYQVLGGHVPKLVEKWTLQRKFNVKQEWGNNAVGTGGPPLWKPFGYNATAGIDVVALRKMKAMDIVNEQREGSKGQGKKTEFELQREQAVKEVGEKSLKQNWCPPAKNLMDKELVDLVKEGFAVEEAEEALKRFKNPRKALQHLRGANKVNKFQDEPKSQPKEKTKWRSIKTDEEDSVEVPREYQRPTKSISLFGFIEEHIKPETAPSKNDDQSDDYQLALSMSVDSYKRENQRSKSRYDGESEFPSLHDKFVKSKSQNDFSGRQSDQSNSNDASTYYSNSKFSRQSSQQYNDYNSRNQKQPTIKRDYPATHKQYESSNRYNKDSSGATDSKYRQSTTYKSTDSRRPTSDYNQREKSSSDYDQQSYYNRGNHYGKAEPDQDSLYQNSNYSSNDTGNSRQNYYQGNNEGKYNTKNNDKYQHEQRKPEFRSKEKDDSGLLNQRTYNEFKSGDSSRGYKDDRGAQGNTYRQSYSGRGFNNRPNDSREDGNSWRQTESKGMNEYRDGDFSSSFGEYRDTGSSGSSRKADTLHNSFEDSNYRDQSKSNNDYQNSGRGGYSRQQGQQRKDIPDRNTYQSNRQSDNSSDPRYRNPANSGGGQYSSQSSRDNYSRGYGQNPAPGNMYSDSQNASKNDKDYYSDSTQSKGDPYGMSSSYSQGRQVQKGRDDYNGGGSNYSRQTMVFTRSSNNGDNGQQDYHDYQRDVFQAGQGMKNMQLGHNSSEPYKQNYHQKPYNNQY